MDPAVCVFPPVWLWVRPYMSVTVAEYYDAVMPGFMEWLKSRPMPQFPNDRGPGFDGTDDKSPRNNPGGWSVPGEDRSETPDDGENDDSSDET